MDALKNFALATVSTGYDDDDTSIDVASGHGAKLPAVPFNVVWWNATDYANPADDPNVEIVRVTARTDDTLTITRAQESTSASTKNTGGKTYKLMQAVTAALLEQRAPRHIEQNAQTGTSYTLALTDVDKLVSMTNAAANELTVPPNSTVAFEVGTVLLVAQLGTGTTTIVAGSGVTIHSRGSALNLGGQYAVAQLVKLATDTWLLCGDVSP